MIQDKQIISKGTYQYSQISDFITVKDYIFARVKEKKCLYLRFSNHTDYTVDAMSFILIQMNSSGEDIGHIEISCSNLRIMPEQTFAYNNGVVVNEYCSDFKVIISKVRSDDYFYLVHDGRVTAYYDIPKTELISGTRAKKPIANSFSVKRRKIGKPRLAVFLAIIMILLTVASNVLYTLLTYSGEQAEQVTKQEELLTDAPKEE